MKDSVLKVCFSVCIFIIACGIIPFAFSVTNVILDKTRPVDIFAIVLWLASFVGMFILAHFGVVPLNDVQVAQDIEY